MGQKVNPNGFRLQIRKDWQSIWYVGGHLYSKFVKADFLIRKEIRDYYKNIAFSKILIERGDCSGDEVDKNSVVYITMHVSSKNKIVHKEGDNRKNFESFKVRLAKIFPNTNFIINVVEAKRQHLDVNLIASSIADQLEKRANYKKIAKRVVETAMRFGDCLGIKIILSGRLAGAEIAKTEIFKNGSIPLHKLSADIYYGLAEAKTTYGIIGIKVYVYLSSFV